MQLRIFTEPQQGAGSRQTARGRAGRGGARFRCLLPLRPLPHDRRERPARAHGLLDHAGRAGPGDGADQARDPGERGDLPLSRAAGHRGGPGGRDERGPDRARAGDRLVRGRARGLRDPVSGLAERFDRLEEQLAIITGLWETPLGKTFSFEGSYYPLTDSPALPKPVQRPRPPIVVGGHGQRRTPRLAARFADEYNVVFVSPEETGAAFGRARDACAAAGRDPASLLYSAGQTVCCGRTRAEVARRAAAIGQDVAQLEATGLAGSPRRSWTSWAGSPASASPGCTCRSSTCTTWITWS